MANKQPNPYGNPATTGDQGELGGYEGQGYGGGGDANPGGMWGGGAGAINDTGNAGDQPHTPVGSGIKPTGPQVGNYNQLGTSNTLYGGFIPFANFLYATQQGLPVTQDKTQQMTQGEQSMQQATQAQQKPARRTNLDALLYDPP